jgi:hypothetical protein
MVKDDLEQGKYLVNTKGKNTNIYSHSRSDLYYLKIVLAGRQQQLTHQYLIAGHLDRGC